jgi:uncharacterized tellurite resistance protein B-like protein
MFDRLLALLDSPPRPAGDTVGAPFARRQLAVVALLLELAQSDRRLGPDEMGTIASIVRERFSLDPGTAEQMIAVAKRELDAALENWIFAQAVRRGFPHDERVGILALLWEVVYADGRLAPLEEALLARLATQLGIGEAECEAARAQAFARRAPRSAATE